MVYPYIKGDQNKRLHILIDPIALGSLDSQVVSVPALR